MNVSQLFHKATDYRWLKSDNYYSHKFWMWFVWRLPRRLIYWASIRMIAHATTGEFDSYTAPEVTAMDALNRWENREQNDDAD